MSTIAVKKVKLGDNAGTSKNFLIEVPAVADGTLTIKREDGTNVLSIAADGKAVIPGVVGTVAQVGGVPTGQVVERGSNANGEYTRFADGTQICTVEHPSQAIAAGAKGTTITWTFPASFTAAPICVAASGQNFSSGSNQAYVLADNGGGRSGSATRWAMINDGPATATLSVLGTAIGRWF